MTAASTTAGRMRAVVQDGYGSPSQLRVAEVPMPAIADDEVLVRVRAASVHPDVWHVVTGQPAVLRVMGAGLRAPKQRIPGTDFAGRVVEVGRDVDAGSFAVGDDVFGESLPSMQWVNGATYAEYVAVRKDRLLPMPAGLSHVEACTLATAGVIALQSIRDQSRVAPGDRLLVNGAAGGVGSLVVQVAKADGATVTGVDGPGKQDLMRTLGADHVIDHTREDFTRGSTRYDVVVDIPGNHPFSEIRRVLEPEGTYVVVGHDQFGRAGRTVLGSIPKMFVLMARARFTPQLPPPSFTSRPKLEHLTQLKDLADAGALRPVIDRTFPLEDVVAAVERLASGEARGRVVLEMGT